MDDRGRAADFGDDSALLGARKPRINVFLVILIALIPWALFYGVYSALAFSLHRYWAFQVWCGVFALWNIPSFCIWLYMKGVKGRKRWSNTVGYLAVATAIALILGTFYGNQNYIKYGENFYKFQGLEAYVNVNPNRDTGTSFMDAGQVYFKEGSHVDTTRGVAMRNYFNFCIAPIILEVLEETGGSRDGSTGLQLPESGSVDFFAVGKDCCQSSGESFTCGEVNNGLARAGLRILNDHDLPFYTMASTMWSHKYGIPVRDPLFVTWVQDPLAKVGGPSLYGQWLFQNTVFAFGIFSAFATLMAVSFAGVGKVR